MKWDSWLLVGNLIGIGVGIQALACGHTEAGLGALAANLFGAVFLRTTGAKI